MKRAFRHAVYREPWQAESIFSRLKRRLGAAVTSRSTRAQRRETLLRILTHNLMILRCRRRVSTKQNCLRIATAGHMMARPRDCVPAVEVAARRSHPVTSRSRDAGRGSRGPEEGT
jgi:hypothetical protein